MEYYFDLQENSKYVYAFGNPDILCPGTVLFINKIISYFILISLP